MPPTSLQKGVGGGNNNNNNKNVLLIGGSTLAALQHFPQLHNTLQEEAAEMLRQIWLAEYFILGEKYFILTVVIQRCYTMFHSREIKHTYIHVPHPVTRLDLDTKHLHACARWGQL